MNNMTENKKKYYRALGDLRCMLSRMKSDIDEIDYALRNENIECARRSIGDLLEIDCVIVDVDLTKLLKEKYLCELGDK